MVFRKNRFGELIDRQLDLFADEHAALLDEIRRHRRGAARAGVEDAEEAFGDEYDRVEWAAEALAELREAYSRTLDEGAVRAYRRAFTKGVRKRFPALADALEAEDRVDDEVDDPDA
jgi:hypothetical protein